MIHLEHPSAHLWEERRNWFESVEEQSRVGPGYLVSEQACALAAEVQSIFCAGAWIGVIVLAMAVIDAALRESELPGFQGNTYQLVEAAGADPKIQDLRRLRNALVHVDPDSPAITVDQQWDSRDRLERRAREAVELMFGAFYLTPWV